MAAALAARLPGGPAAALAAAQRGGLAGRARGPCTGSAAIGLEALLRMPPAEVPEFFEVFFALPERHRWAYLTGRDDLRGHRGHHDRAVRPRPDWGLRRG